MSAELLINVATTFEEVFGYKGQYKIQAPGRVNLIGEHTDYNDGFVLPCAINYQTVVVASPRKDDIVRIVSIDYDREQDSFDLTQPITSIDKGWANYIRGVIKHLKLRGYHFSGADIAVGGNVPQGAGLSSSAALEVVIGQTFKTLYNLDISQQDIALNGQEAENNFVGCNCGIMDQLISAQAKERHALLIDCRSLVTSAVSIPEGISIVIVNSNKKRGLVDSEYNTRREQCESAAEFFGVKALRDVSIDDFNNRKAGLDPITAKRAKHIITENNRTIAAAQALKENNMPLLQKLMAESHDSMRYDFNITVNEIDVLVDIIKSTVGNKGGVRMTGGGFGGCVVSLIPDALVHQVIKAVEDEYTKQTSLVPSIFVCTPKNGAGEVI